MAWKARYDSTNDAVELVLVGVVTGDALREATAAAIDLAQKHDASRGIIDAVEQEQTATITELYDFPAQYDAQGLDRGIRIALVVPKREELHDIAVFYENVCVNRGWQVHRCATREEAMEWLLSG
ncbi:MAG: hypothetical protein QNJ00_01855 [Woeseiaceae bacterium]|nr:hypothetical protein [Woeseiaceae bacterium]